MALQILVSKNPNSTQRVSLNGYSFSLRLVYSPRQESWHIDLSLANNRDLILSGIKLQPNQNLTGRYKIPILSGGDLYCIRAANTNYPLNYENLGPGKDYSLVWITDAEKESLGISATTTFA